MDGFFSLPLIADSVFFDCPFDFRAVSDDGVSVSAGVLITDSVDDSR